MIFFRMGDPVVDIYTANSTHMPIAIQAVKAGNTLSVKTIAMNGPYDGPRQIPVKGV